MISVVLRTEYTVGDGEPVSILETVNCYLDETNDLGAEQTELTMENMLNVNDDFANLVHTAVQNQTSVKCAGLSDPGTGPGGTGGQSPSIFWSTISW